jgi:hypothetical protein
VVDGCRTATVTTACPWARRHRTVGVRHTVGDGDRSAASVGDGDP